MRCSSATKSEIKSIRTVLEEAKEKPYSKDFLDGFPCDSTDWFNCKISRVTLGNSYLFWDGEAWSEPEKKIPRNLKQGVFDFRQINYNPAQANTKHLEKIIDLKINIETSSFQNSEPLPILIGLDKDSPLMILDGNHRLAALWWAGTHSNQITFDINFWIGFSPDMNKYYYYSRIPLTSTG